MNKDLIIQQLKDNKDVLSDQFGIETIGLFGSVAKGTTHTSSDLDLVYITKEGTRVGYSQKVALEQYLKNLLSMTKLDLINFKYMNPIIKQAMEKDVIYV